MKILMIQSSPFLPSYHGASLSNRQLLEALAARGHTCRALATAHLSEPGYGRREFLELLDAKGIPRDRTGDVDIFRYNGVEVFAAEDVNRLRACVRTMAATFDPSWVIVSTEDPGQVLLELALDTFGGRVVYTAHTPTLIPADDKSPFGNRTKAALLKRVAAVVAVSAFAKSYIDRLIDVRSVVLPLLRFGRPPFPSYGSFSRGYVMCINPSDLKGISIFLKVARRMPDVPFAAVAAWGTSAADRRALCELRNVTILEPTEDIESFYSQARVLLVPSLCAEGWARVVSEAMLRGIPVVGSDAGAVPEAMLGVGRVIPVRPITEYAEQFDRFGRWTARPLIPAQDATPWCDAIQELLTDRELYERTSARCREAAHRHVAANGIEVVERFLERLEPAPSTVRDDGPPAVLASAAAEDLQGRIKQLPPRRRAALVALLRQRGLLQAERSPIPQQPRRDGPADEFPVSCAQHQMWVAEQLSPGNAAFTLPTALRLRGRLDVRALDGSVTALVTRHEALRTVFPRRDDEPVQHIERHMRVNTRLVDLTGLDHERGEREARRLVHADAARPFAIAAGPLLRVTLVRLGREHHILLFTTHHLVSDGASSGVLVREFTMLYESFATGRHATLPELPLQYADYAVWQRQELEGAASRDLDYWRQKLSGRLPILALPGARPRPADAAWRGGQVRRRSNALANSLEQVAQRRAATLFMTLVAGLQVLLRDRTGAEDVIVGTDVSGRHRQELEGVVGLFVNQLALRGDLRGDPTFACFLDQIKRTTLEAHASQNLPFERLVAALNPERAAGRQPLFQVKLILRNPKGGAFRVGADLLVEPAPVPYATAHLDLLFNVAQLGSALDVTVEYDLDRYDQPTIERLAEDYLALLSEIARGPDRTLSALSEALAESARTKAQAQHATYEGFYRSRARSARRRVPAAVSSLQR